MSLFLSVVVPAYNEEGIIADNLAAIARFLADNLSSEQGWEIIAVNDGSGDGTGPLLDQLARERPYLAVEHHPRNLGRGRALRTGFTRAQGQYVVSLDADLSYHPSHIMRMLPPLLTGQADLVLASAFHPEGTVKNVPWKRAAISRMGNRLLSFSLDSGLHTVTCVVRAYRREVLDSLELVSDDKDIHLEILFKALMLGYRAVEVPADLHWLETKRTTVKRGTFKAAFGRTSSAHLFFNFLFRPSLLFYLPLAVLGLISLVIFSILPFAYLDLLAAHAGEADFVARHMATLRDLLLNSRVSFFVLGFCLLLLIQFLTLSFLAKQNKRYFEELFILLTRQGARLRRLEGKK